MTSAQKRVAVCAFCALSFGMTLNCTPSSSTGCRLATRVICRIYGIWSPMTTASASSKSLIASMPSS